MSVLPEEKVLRVNCPGFGVSSTLPLGEAKPLAMYDVIIVNPTSIAHLFDGKSDALKQIELLQSDGMTSYRADDDSLIYGITAELDIRAQELTQFLKKGGLLIYFLVPPFVVAGPGQQLDNYSWLGEWAPDKATEPGHRNMSATIRGKASETSADAAQSVWVPYLKQAGLEWSTIIRLENLTDGYVPLSTAGPNKCVAGFKSSGPKAGQVVFLPAPWDAEYDSVLKECVERWYAIHSDDAAASTGLQNLSKGLSSLLTDDDLEATGSTAVLSKPASAAATPEAAPTLSEEADPKLAAFLSGSSEQKSDDLDSAFDALLDHKDEAPNTVAPVEAVESEAAPLATPPELEKSLLEDSWIPSPILETPQFFDEEKPAACNGNESHPEAQDLIKKMQQEISKPSVPDWCSRFSFEELEGLRQEHSDVNEEIRLAQLKAQELAARIERMEDLKNALLSAQGEFLLNACTRVFERLGWEVKPALGSPEELWLIDDNKTQAIVRLNWSEAQPNRSELASLAESVITYWGAHEVEPKGILVASTHASLPPSERPDEDFGDAMNDFAKRKNLCLLTTAQLLSIYRDLDISEVNPKSIRENVLTTSGRVTDYAFNKKGVKVKA